MDGVIGQDGGHVRMEWIVMGTGSKSGDGEGQWRETAGLTWTNLIELAQ